MMVYTIGWALGKSFLFVSLTINDNDGAQEYKKKGPNNCPLSFGPRSDKRDDNLHEAGFLFVFCFLKLIFYLLLGVDADNDHGQ